MFRGVFGREDSIELSEALINAVFINAGKPPVKLVRILNPFQLEDLAGQKEPILDILARDSSGQYVDIEVQVADHDNFRERMLYYWSRVYGGQLKEGQEYTELRPVIGIILVRFPIHARYQTELWDTVELTYGRHRDERYTNHLFLHFVTIPDIRAEESTMADINEDLKRWLMTMNYPQNKEKVKMFAEFDPNIAKTIEKADQFLADPQVTNYLEAHHRAIATQATLMRSNLRKGMKRGMKKGLAKGLAKGRAEGLAEGRADTTVKNAKKFLTSRFGQLPPAIIQALDQKVESISNEAECDRIVDLAIHCASLEEFVASL